MTVFEKIKKYIHRIKRHKRNRKLSKFADIMFQVSRNSDYKIGLNPLIYEIIHSRYSNEFISNLIPDHLSKDIYSEFLIFC